MDGVQLVFEESALDFIVKQAIQYKLGARGLRSITERIMKEAMFDAPKLSKGSSKLCVTAEYCREQIAKYAPPLV